MISIRLRREGATNHPFYKIVVADSRARRDGRFIEQVGNYNPLKVDENANLDLDRVEYWLSQGARPSDTVASLIKRAKRAGSTTT
jgi:small subunit ribosomal protein S16